TLTTVGVKHPTSTATLLNGFPRTSLTKRAIFPFSRFWTRVSQLGACAIRPESTSRLAWSTATPAAHARLRLAVTKKSSPYQQALWTVAAADEMSPPDMLR